MTDPLFRAAVTNVLISEGGLSDHPNDPGGLTNMGISIRAFPHLGVDGIRHLTREKAIAIYHDHYWRRIPDTLPDDLRWMAFDSAVNHGVSRALGWLGLTTNLAQYTATRLRFYASLSTWESFGKGWTRRVAHVLEGISAWEASLAPIPHVPRAAEPALAGPVRIGEFEVTVMHDFGPQPLLRMVDACLAGERTVVLGESVASVTGTRKLDVRLIPRKGA
jgi:lysozyme family protein